LRAPGSGGVVYADEWVYEDAGSREEVSPVGLEVCVYETGFGGFEVVF
jgi:hypothetical protein